jgi:hypothetical protein
MTNVFGPAFFDLENIGMILVATRWAQLLASIWRSAWQLLNRGTVQLGIRSQIDANKAPIFAREGSNELADGSG